MTERSLIEGNNIHGSGLLVVVWPATLWRDCLVGCLESNGYAVVPVTSVAQWLNVSSGYPAPAAVLVCDPRQLHQVQLSRVIAQWTTITIIDADGAFNLQSLVQQGIQAIVSPATTSMEVMLGAIRFAASGGTLIPASLTASHRNDADFGRILTERQMQVVEEIRKGKPNKEIAHRLNLRESTVKVHITQIMRKLHARNRTEIAVLANELHEITRDLSECAQD